ncbi:MAG: zinc ribbon domain-containing protein [Bryobacterales bacterium]|nr:zinc ribbon domain-containing protein [Bryobacterales bacterium]
MMTFDRHVIGALVRHQQLAPGALGAPFYDVPPDPAYVQQVAQWHQAQPADAKLSPQALAVLATPDLVADIRSLTGRDSMLHTWALARADCQPGPILLMAPKGEEGKQLEIQLAPSREVLADTMLLWLVGAGAPSEPEMHVQMSHAELAVLFAFIDLYSRAKFSAFMAHRTQESSFDHRYITQAYQEGVNSQDPRWLLGLALPLLDEAARRLDGNGVWQCIHTLAQRRLLEAAGQEWKLTLPGEYLAESLHRRTVSVTIDTAAADGQGGLGTHAAMLIRADDPLWLIDLPPGGTAAVCGVSVQAARQVLDAVLTPAGRAPASRAAQPPQPPQAVAPHPATPHHAGTLPGYGAQHQGGYPAQPGMAHPPVAAPPARPHAAAVCPVCRQQIAPGTVFCGNCGARLR